MKGFPGFEADEKQVALPASFFAELLPAIDDLAELKLTLYLLQGRAAPDGPPLFSREALEERADLLSALAAAARRPAEAALEHALERATARGTLLHLVMTRGDESQHFYALNDPAGRELAEAVRAGRIQDVGELAEALSRAAWRVERPNIFVLYEQNIGLLQPLIADELREAERTYPMGWIEEAFQIAAGRNARNWRYVRAILERWAREGKTDGTDQRDSQSGRRYVEGEYGPLIRR